MRTAPAGGMPGRFRHLLMNLALADKRGGILRGNRFLNALMPRKKDRSPRHMVSRAGGVAVAVVKKPLPDGTTGMQISLNLRELAVPERRYAADVAGVSHDGTQVKLLFAQKKISGDELRSLIVITMSTDAIHQFLDTCDEFIPQNDKHMLEHKIGRVAVISPSKEPEQTVAMAANIVALARAGSEATADFHHASPAAMHALQQQDHLEIEPIVRVDLPLGVLASLLDELVSLSSIVPRRVP